MTTQEKALEIYRRLAKANPHPQVELAYSNPFELLVATILSAQSTDRVVNTVTPMLFKKFPTPAAFAASSPEEINASIMKINFHNNKAKHIWAAAKKIVTDFRGEVPQTMQELTSLPGVARKTANVILGSAFGKAEGIVIDTHGIRLANKLGLTTSKDPVKIEQDLMKMLPKETWIDFGQLLTLHGRYICTSRTHTCEDCPLGDLCPEYTKILSLNRF
jgi:endonuclease III